MFYRWRLTTTFTYELNKFLVLVLVLVMRPQDLVLSPVLGFTLVQVVRSLDFPAEAEAALSFLGMLVTR